MKTEIFLDQLYPWFLVIIFLIHDGEELFFLPGWLRNNSGRFETLSARFPFAKPVLNFFSKTNQQRFNISVFFLLTMILATTLLQILYPADTTIQLIYLGVTIIFIAHFLVHGLQSLIVRGVVPGTFTSIVLFPISLFVVVDHISRAGYSRNQNLVAVLVGMLVFIPGFLIAHSAGYWLDKK